MEHLPSGESDPLVRSRRTFSKRMLAVNVGLAWLLVFWAVFYLQAEHVVTPALALVGTLYAAYTGIGHLDLRSLAKFNRRDE